MLGNEEGWPKLSNYLSPEQVLEIAPGLTKNHLAQLRYRGEGPVFLKPTPKKVLYRQSDVVAWLEASAHERTGRLVDAAQGGARG